MAGPLTGVTITDLTTVIMGPFATQILGDMGADVIKIEHVNGDVLRYANEGRSSDMSNLFMNCNRNKRSLTLNLKHPDGRAILLKLIADSDVFVSNVRPQALQRLGLSYEALAEVNPQLVYVSCFGFGQDGPYAARPAYDDLIQAMIGVPDLFVRAYGGEPRFIPSNFCDRVTGLSVVNAVTSALFYRERTGHGQSVEVPMFETMLQFLMSDHMGGYTFEPPNGDIGYARVINPHRRPYQTKDGYIALLVYNDGQWERFFTMIGQPELIGTGIFADHATRGLHIHQVYGFVSDTLKQRPSSEWLALLQTADIPHSAIAGFETLFQDEHLNEIGFFQMIDHPTEGWMRTTRIPATWSESQPQIRRPAPRLGQHSRQLLNDLGYQDHEIAAFIEAGITTSIDQ